jgi:WD40 repeat protein
MGSAFGAFQVTPANVGGSSSPFTTLFASGTPLGKVTGRVLAVSQNGNLAVFSDTLSTPNQVYIVNTTQSSTTALNINSATAAAFSPDGLRILILGNGGNTLYIYSTLQALQSYPLASPAKSIAFNSTGSFALLAGGNSPSSTLSIRNTCDNSAVSLAVPGPGLPAPPLFLKMVPAGNVPTGNIIPDLQLQGLDIFFGLDNTGIDIIATNSPLNSVPPTILCPQPVVLAYTPQNVTFDPVHINIGYGTFHPIAFFLSPDTTQAYVVTTDFGVLAYHFNTGSVSGIPLINNAAPVAADITSDGTLLYVAGSDGLLHELNTETGIDQTQTTFAPLPNSANAFCYTGTNCTLNLIAVKP